MFLLLLFAVSATAFMQYVNYDEYANTCDAVDYAPSVLENHKPSYDIGTKVAAPVYILPKHGSVVEHKEGYGGYDYKKWKKYYKKHHHSSYKKKSRGGKSKKNRKCKNNKRTSRSPSLVTYLPDVQSIENRAEMMHARSV